MTLKGYFVSHETVKYMQQLVIPEFLRAKSFAASMASTTMLESVTLPLEKVERIGLRTWFIGGTVVLGGVVALTMLGNRNDAHTAKLKAQRDIVYNKLER